MTSYDTSKNFYLVYRHLLMDTNPTSHEFLLHLFQYCLNNVDKKRSTTTTSTTTTTTTTTTKFRNRRFLTLNIFKTIEDNRLKFYIHGNNPVDFIKTKFQVATISASPFCRPSKMPILACFLILYVMGLASTAHSVGKRNVTGSIFVTVCSFLQKYMDDGAAPVVFLLLCSPRRLASRLIYT